MKKLTYIFLFLLTFSGFSQENLSELLKQHNEHSVPYISVQELAMPKTNALVLDARERAEFEVSHLKNAQNVGYNEFDINVFEKIIPEKSQMIVVYCSLGIRSEKIGEKLQDAGYENVFNLYGGIFEWKNNDFQVFDSQGNPTENVHAFSKEWSKWLLKGKKIYD